MRTYTLFLEVFYIQNSFGITDIGVFRMGTTLNLIKSWMHFHDPITILKGLKNEIEILFFFKSVLTQCNTPPPPKTY